VKPETHFCILTDWVRSFRRLVLFRSMSYLYTCRCYTRHSWYTVQLVDLCMSDLTKQYVTLMAFLQLGPTRKAAWFTEQLFRAYPARPAPVQQAHYFTSDTRLGPFGLRMLAFCLARICRIQVPLSGLFSVITNNDPMRYRRHYNVVRLSGLSHHRVFG